LIDAIDDENFIIIIEGGRIDHGHHDGKGKKALEEFVMFDDSIGLALNMTYEDETLIVVTADHSVFSQFLSVVSS
jgi:alkaline phosphatase